MHILSRPWNKVGGAGSRSHRKFSSALRTSVWSKDKGGGRAPGSFAWIPHCYLSNLKPTASIRKERPWCCIFSQTLKKLNLNAPINIMLAGRGGRAWGGDLIVVVGPGVGHLTDLVLPGEGIFESFFARRGDIWLPTRTKKTETEHMFPTSTLHACAVRSGKIWKSWRPTRTSENWVDFTVLSSNFISCVLACFWSIELLKILWYQSKRK